ncbi:hypothetical protein CPB83DRAFT_748323, partial [Crepidotus variabilis]
LSGHYELWKDGWLHRDVSINNILLMETPQEHKLGHFFSGFACSWDKILSEGMLIDGDHAVKVNPSERVQASLGLAGTLPFISYHLLENWGGADEHTVADDLESFGWVLVISLLQISQRLGPFTQKESRFFKAIHNEEDPESISCRRSHFAQALLNQSTLPNKNNL